MTAIRTVVFAVVLGLAAPAVVSISTGTDFLTGHLDDVDGMLNLRAGAGRHLLMISTSGSPTRTCATRRRRSVASSPDAMFRAVMAGMRSGKPAMK